MAQWIYDLEGSYVWEEGAAGWPARTVATDVHPKDGPRIAQVLAMETLLRDFLADDNASWPGDEPECPCALCVRARDILRIAEKGD